MHELSQPSMLTSARAQGLMTDPDTLTLIMQANP